MGLFFYSGGQLSPRLLYDQFSIFLGQMLKLLISSNGFFENRQLVLRDVATNVLTVLPSLMVVIRTIGTFPQKAKFAPFHVVDLGDLLEDGVGSG